VATKTSQRVGIWVIAGVMLFGTLGAFFLPILTNNSESKEAAEQQKLLDEYQKQMAACPTGEVTDKKISPAPIPPEAPVVEDVPELKTTDLSVGSGEVVEAGDCVEILFHGTLASSGKAFNGGSNYSEGTPYRSITTGFVPGFAEGIVGMKVGGERQIQIPSAKGYGDQASGEIPANADLIFTIKLVGIYTQ
jgi:FKBP-type peptidyl-prolyl cis-trans isomerase